MTKEPVLVTLERNGPGKLGFDIIPFNCGGTIAFPQNDMEAAECTTANNLQSDPTYKSLDISYSTVKLVLDPYFTSVQGGGPEFTPTNAGAAIAQAIAAEVSVDPDVAYAVLWELWNNAQNNPGSIVYQLWKGTASQSVGIFGDLFQGIGNLLKSLGTVGAILPYAAGAALIVWGLSYLPKRQ